eukprot:CAMPEP_0184374588 /NCGR_PEP_ID=MMETSP1089-20130417/165106_1 /TAXON_ID=38269 ORGANISM="Gloeochaete wittrockiana, Strain SAG46.84" /NCGR_SAMPLE_ID=MMETSP1089 /ASSEMBLY_ACC=CAM_ASM_000445 /LENGTH=330 /DNA_ID=CAMNT_0026717605 /DNA_START=264 /DNA_END=1253 /DNA_ORIENTATION=+
MGRSNNLALQVTTHITSAKARALIVRYLNLSHALIYKQATSNDDYSDLIASQLITESELEILKSVPSRYMFPYLWITKIINQCARAGRLMYPEPILHSMADDVTTMRGRAAEMVQDFFGYFFLIANRLVYEGILALHAQLANPFGDDACDFPDEDFRAAVFKTTNALINAPTPFGKLFLKKAKGMDKDSIPFDARYYDSDEEDDLDSESPKVSGQQADVYVVDRHDRFSGGGVDEEQSMTQRASPKKMSRMDTLLGFPRQETYLVESPHRIKSRSSSVEVILLESARLHQRPSPELPHIVPSRVATAAPLSRPVSHSGTTGLAASDLLAR